MKNAASLLIFLSALTAFAAGEIKTVVITNSTFSLEVPDGRASTWADDCHNLPDSSRTDADACTHYYCYNFNNPNCELATFHDHVVAGSDRIQCNSLY